MAKYRQVHTSFWQDAFVLDLTPEEKYFYLYLMTNNKTTQCGIYELPIRVIELETGYNRDTVKKLIDRFIDYGKVIYNEENKEIMIVNWFKYNLIKSTKVIACINKELKEVKTKEFLEKLYRMDTVSEIKDTLSIDYGEEEEKEEEEEREEEVEGEAENPQAAVHFYQQNLGVLNAFIGECLMNWCKDLNAQLVIEAMKRALAQQKKWKYAEGILRDWANNNVKTLDDVTALDAEFNARKENQHGSNNRGHSAAASRTSGRKYSIEPPAIDFEQR